MIRVADRQHRPAAACRSRPEAWQQIDASTLPAPADRNCDVSARLRREVHSDKNRLETPGRDAAKAPETKATIGAPGRGRICKTFAGRSGCWDQKQGSSLVLTTESPR